MMMMMMMMMMTRGMRLCRTYMWEAVIWQCSDRGNPSAMLLRERQFAAPKPLGRYGLEDRTLTPSLLYSSVGVCSFFPCGRDVDVLHLFNITLVSQSAIEK
mmetsp:Transcript_11533/g.23253  ORF Transcript_11533/g.23253 Transcript_11533/m.23253 type:complete len:101 (-) Transcript_11533:214-516(-)